MKNKFYISKMALRTVLFILLLSIAGMTKAQTENITFADAIVKAYCVANWDTDGDGELSQAEAAAVTSLDGVFMFDGDITSFNELQFFTGLTSFGEDEFNSCTNLSAISIPSAVTTIGSYAFSDCSSLASITSYACTPPALGSNVFDNVPSAVVFNVPCHTAALYQAADGWSDFANYEEFEYGLCPIIFADDNVKATCVAHWDTNGDSELSYDEAAAVTNLGTYLKSTAITSFEELEYFTSLTSLPNTAFYGCTSLASIALPSSVSALGNGSFYNCTNLATMTVYAETPPTVGTNAFKNVPTDMVVYVPCGTYEAYHTASGWSEFTIIQQSGFCPIVFADANVKALCVANWDTNGDGELSYDEAAAVTDLGEVFKNKYSITSFNELQYFINLTSIGNSAFSNCHSLTSVEIPSSVTSMGTNPFGGCSGLEQIVVASNNANYDSRENCNAIIRTSTNALVVGCKNTVIPNTVTSIGDGAFSSCTSLTSVEIPSSVTSIGYEAFYNCTSLTSIEFPNSVTSIGDYAFRNCTSLTSIELPSSVTSIGFETFYYCTSLTSAEIPSSVTSIGSFAFSYCISLTSVEIPSSVTSIGTNPFVGCRGLEQIVVDSDNANYDSRGNCNAIISTSNNKLIVGCKNTVIPNSVTSIGNYAFRNCTSLTSIELPSSVTSIGFEAFYYCTSLTSVASFADTPPTLGSNVFYNVNKTIPVYVPCGASDAYQGTNGWNEFTNIMGMCAGEVVVTINPTEGGTVTGAGYYFEGDICILMATPNPGFVFVNWTENGVVSSNPVYSFYAHPTTIVANFSSNSPISFVDANVKALCVANWDTNDDGELSYTEAAAVTDLGQVFEHNSSITSFNELLYFINLTSIGNYAFEYCTSLTSIEIPNSVTSIGNSAFSNCHSLTSVEIPSSVTSMGTNPFGGCSGLEQIVVASNNANYDSRENCNAIIRTSTNALVVGCKNTVIPNTVTSIGSSAFYYCTGLTSVEIPNSVTSIGNSAFSNCHSLTSVEIPSSVTSIGANPFVGCRGLEQIVVDSDNANYDSRGNCNAIISTSNNKLIVGCKNTVIPNTVTSIGDYAFRNCTSLTSIELPSSVTSIGFEAFEYCTGLSSMIVFSGTPPTLGDFAFYQVNKSILVYVPCDASEAYQSTNGWNEFTNIMGMCPGTITVAALPTEGGSVTGGGLFEGGGAICTLTATANHDYHFLNWTENGEVVSYDAEYTFIVAGDRNLVANFFFTPPAPVVAEYYPDSNEPNSPYVKVHWAAGPYEVMIGDSTSTINTAYMPFYTLYDNSISEALYTAAELIEAGATAGSITSLSWEAVSVTTNQPQYNISIWMANVPDTELTTTSHLASNMTLVYTGNIGIPPLGWNEFFFNESNFVWDGTSNVLILCQRNNGQWNGSVRWRSHDPGFYGMAYKYQDGTPYDVTSQIYTLYLSNTVRPNIIMKCERPMTYNLYRANCDGTNAQLIAENLNDTQYIDETWWQLENDNYKYGVSVADSTNTDIFWSNCIEKQGNMAAQIITLSSGPNWFSTYLEITKEDLQNALLAALSNPTGAIIKSQDGNSTYRGGRWRDQNFVWDVAKMYMIVAPEDCEIALTGVPINPADHPITIAPNAPTWIGFPFDESKTPAQVIPAGFAVNGDIIKGMGGNIRYNNGSWRAQGMNILEPGKGYIYNSASAVSRTLVFPTSAK